MEGYALQAVVVDSLIHADCNISVVKTRLGQLIPVVGLGKFPDAVLLKEFECHSEVR